MHDLEVLYDQVPATRCAGTGDCCWLTDEEFDNYYATMFPLYRVEYLYIVAYIERHFFPAASCGVAAPLPRSVPAAAPFSARTIAVPSIRCAR